jgi:CMP-N-acetylneuraminic acid synthetase
MKKKIKILAVIPCRSGSKGIKNKNIINIFGKPLVFYSIYFAKQCKFIDRVIVSTDSKKYAQICKNYGAEVPFLRPKNFSTDFSLDVDFFKHAIDWLKKYQNYQPDFVIHLRPTSPIRRIKDLKECLKIIKKNKKINSVRSISKENKSIYKCWFLSSKNKLKQIVKNKTLYREPFNAPRQKLKSFYCQNGLYDIFRTKLITKRMISGKNIYGYINKNKVFNDIDSLEDFKNLKKYKNIFINFKKYITS